MTDNKAQAVEMAARALLAAFGGDTPDFLKAQAQALENALDGAPKAKAEPITQPAGTVYRVQLARDYTIVEGMDVYIRAKNEDEAEEAASRLADDWDDDVPDSISEIGGSDISAFTPRHVEDAMGTETGNEVYEAAELLADAS